MTPQVGLLHLVAQAPPCGLELSGFAALDPVAPHAVPGVVRLEFNGRQIRSHSKSRSNFKSREQQFPRERLKFHAPSHLQRGIHPSPFAGFIPNP